MITVATPATTPRRVRKLRSFCARIAHQGEADVLQPGEAQARRRDSAHHSALRASTTGRFEALRAGQ